MKERTWLVALIIVGGLWLGTGLYALALIVWLP